MINERVAIGGRTGALAPRARPTEQRVRGAKLVLADGERLLQSIQHSTLLQLILAMSFIAMAALMYLAQASQISVLQYNIAGLQSQRADLMSQNANLQATATGLRVVNRIETIATTQLHMIKPGPSATIWVSPVVPAVPRLHLASQSIAAAERRSQPLSWMTSAVSTIRASL